MKKKLYQPGLIAALAVFLLSGCYTQLQTFEPRHVTSESDSQRGYIGAQSDDSQLNREEREERRAQIPEDEEETYLYGYEDGVEEGYEEGWIDAEEYYFKDYETARWYRERGFSLSRDHHFVHHNNRYYYDSPHSSRYGYGYYPSRFYLSFHFGGWHSWRHYRPVYYHDYYAWHYDPYYRWDYYRYPFYRPYYGSPYYGNTYVFFNNYNRRIRPASNRTYSPRSTGFRNEGVTRNQNQVRRDAIGTESVNGKRSGTTSLETRKREIRRDVSSPTRSGTVNRSSGSRSTGSVDRSPTNRSGSSAVRQRGNVDRSRSSGNSSSVRQRSSGTRSSTERQRGSIRSIESSNRSQSSRTIQSSGDINRQERNDRVIRSRSDYSVGSGSDMQSIQNRIQARTSNQNSAIKVKPPTLNNNTNARSNRPSRGTLFRNNSSRNSSSILNSSRSRSNRSSSVKSSSRSRSSSSGRSSSVRSKSSSSSSSNGRSSGSSSSKRSRGN